MMPYGPISSQTAVRALYSPIARRISLRETKAWTAPERAKPKTSAHNVSQNMKNASCKLSPIKSRPYITLRAPFASAKSPPARPGILPQHALAAHRREVEALASREAGSLCQHLE